MTDKKIKQMISVLDSMNGRLRRLTDWLNFGDPDDILDNRDDRIMEIRNDAILLRDALMKELPSEPDERTTSGLESDATPM